MQEVQERRSSWGQSSSAEYDFEVVHALSGGNEEEAHHEMAQPCKAYTDDLDAFEACT